MTKPNILMIVADQHRQDCLGISGHPLLKTPNLDALARSGTNFTSAFTSSPICIPARNSLLHGVWPCRHLSIANADTEAPRPAEPIPAYPELLRAQGYSLAFVGKWLGGRARSPEDYGFHTYVPYGAYSQWREAQKLPPRPGGMPFFGVDEGVTPEQSRLAWGARQVMGLLEQAAASDAPFYIRWDPSEPHLPNVVPQPFADMYNPKDIPPWPSFGDNFTNKPYIQAQQLRSWKLDGWSWDQWAHLVARYLGEISLLDNCIGSVLERLNTLGLDDNTIVIYTCDHGDMCGAHGMIDKHYVMYEDVIHVPLIIRCPGASMAGHACDAFVTHTIDLARSLCEWAGAKTPDSFQGQSLIPFLNGTPCHEKDDVLGMYHGNQFGLYSQRMVRNRHWKYVWNATAQDELYNLDWDRGELFNLAQDPLYADTLASLRLRLHEYMREVGDPLDNLWIRRQLLEGCKI